MRINNNLMAMNTHRQLGAANAGGAKSMEKLSSGMRINRAGDDAAGLSISEKMRGQIRGLNQASANAQDGISMIQTAEGALNETHAILQRMRELSVQSSTDTNVNALDRESIHNEFNQLKEEIDRIGNTTEFNTQKLIDGSVGAKKMAGTDNAAIIGSAVGKETAAKAEGTAITPAANLLNGLVADAKNTIYVDGAKIEFKLDADRITEYKGAAAEGKDIAALMKEDINNAITEYNTNNETSIAKVEVEFTSDKKINITSGTKGDTSTIKMDQGAATDLFVLTGLTTTTAGKESAGTEGVFSAAGAASAGAVKNGTTVSFVQGDHTVTIDLGAENAEFAKDLDFATAATGTEGAVFTGNKLTITPTDGTSTAASLQATIRAITANVPEGFDVSKVKVSAVVTAGGAAHTGVLTGAAAKDVGTIKGGIDSSNVTIDGTEIKVNWASTGANPPEEGESMKDFAANIQTDINNAIKAYNKTVDSDKKLDDVTVSVKDGSLQVQSGSEEATSSIKFDNSETAQLLGLAKQSSSTQGGGVDFQIGANTGQHMNVTIEDMRSDALGIAEVDLSTKEGARAAMDTINDAINNVSNQRSNLGAFQNRLEHTIKNLDNSAENLQAAEARIRDVDMAKEMMEQTKQNILAQASTAMLAQANQAPQAVLQLLR